MSADEEFTRAGDNPGKALTPLLVNFSLGDYGPIGLMVLGEASLPELEQEVTTFFSFLSKNPGTSLALKVRGA